MSKTNKTKDGFSTWTKFLIVFGVVVLIALAYTGIRSLAGTNINLTLTSNPNLEDGLVAHWTMDGDDIDTSKVNAEVRDRKSSGQDWYGSSWTYRQKIEINPDHIDSDLSKYPVYVDLGDFGSGFWDNVESDCGDIRVTYGNGSAEAPREIVSCDTSSNSGQLHFAASSTNSTTVSSSGTSTAYIYYGNSGASNYSNTAKFGRNKVWTKYEAVYHMDEDPSGTAPQIIDSTGNGHDGTSNGSMTSGDEVSGQVGNAIEFDGSGDYISIPEAAVLDVASNEPLQIELWLNYTSTPSSEVGIFGKSGGPNQVGWALKSFNNGALSMRYHDGDAEFTEFMGNYEDSGWKHLSAVLQSDHSSVTSYVDGSVNGSESYSGLGDTSNGRDLNIAALGGTEFSGTMPVTMDEIRMAKDDTFSDAWNAATYSNQTASSFYTLGSQETEEANNHGDWLNHATTTVSGRMGQAIDFDGSDDYIALPDGMFSFTDGSNDFTFAAWVNPDKVEESRFVLSTQGDYDWNFGQKKGGAFELKAYEAGTGDHRVETPYSTDEWQHFVGVYDSSSGLELYKNGQSVDTNSWTGTPASRSRDNAIAGETGFFNEFYDGQIDDVRVYNRALSAEEVKRLYGLGATTKINKTLTTNPNLENNLIGHWTFDGKDMQANVADISGNNNDGKLETGGSGTSTAIGRVGQALKLDGSDDYVDVSSAGNDLDYNNFTFSAWFKSDTSTLSDDNLIWSHDDGDPGGNNTDAMWLGPTDNSGSVGEFRLDVDEAGAVDSTTNVYDTEWHHLVAVVENGDTGKVYVDGTLENTGSITAPDESVMTNGPYIGDRVVDPELVDGVVDDVRVYDRALSTSEIQRLYDLGATTKINKTLETDKGTKSNLTGHWTFDGPDMTTNVADISGNNNDGKINGQTSTSTAIGRIGQALSFDGTDDYITMADDAAYSGLSAVSVSVWFRAEKWRTDCGSGTQCQNFLIAKSNWADNREYRIRYESELGSSNNQALVWHVSSDGSDPGLDEATTSISNVPAGEWHHAVGTYSATTDTLNFYIDGSLVDTATYTSSGLYDGSANFSIGSSGNDGASTAGRDNWFGEVDDARVYNKALSAEEVKRLYQLGQ